MKKIGLLVTAMILSLTVSSQPRPFEIDQTFIPTEEYLQKTWTGAYDGYETNSRMILSISRTLTLHSDNSYTNEIKGRVNQLGIQSDNEIVIKYEYGVYQYNLNDATVSYYVEKDSTLDINTYLQGKTPEYEVKNIENNPDITSSEKVQFTKANKDDTRQWVLFDPQLKSPIDNRQPAVYVMTGIPIILTGLKRPKTEYNTNSDYYNLNGHKISNPTQGIFITKGRKIFIRQP